MENSFSLVDAIGDGFATVLLNVVKAILLEALFYLVAHYSSVKDY